MAVLTLTAIAGCGGVSASSSSPQPNGTRLAVAATNSYLEVAAADIAGENFEIVPLAGPGACPGHFDLRPSQIERLCACRLLVRFDFQKRLEQKLNDRVGDSLTVAAIEIEGGMCRPSSYAETCRQIADAMVEAGCLDRATADARLVQIDKRMASLKAWGIEQIDSAGLRGLPVITSSHQDSFCKELGLDVVATYPSGTSQPSRFDEAVADARAGKARLLIANLPEGRRTADMLADRLGIEAVVFGNFPRPGDATAFDDLVRGNVAELLSNR